MTFKGEDFAVWSSSQHMNYKGWKLVIEGTYWFNANPTNVNLLGFNSYPGINYKNGKLNRDDESLKGAFGLYGQYL